MFLLGLGRDPATVPSALIDKPVPSFALGPLVDGKPGFASGDLKGQVRLVNVFASWCAPCRSEHPLLMRLTREGVVVFGIDYKDDADAARQWLASLGDPFQRIGVDRSGQAAIDWGVYGVPETFVVDRDGIIRYKQVGPITPEALTATILPLLRRLSQ
ncbi:MAG: DsbE family thiol:disulfide interchange protein [Proteobacteria bacterium]|nr:DsbE family thiol:disulfide interchange protein [Pseudomonadota bacterium]